MSSYGFIKRTESDITREKEEEFKRCQEQLQRSGLVDKVVKILNEYGIAMYGAGKYSITSESDIFFPTLPFIDKHRTKAHFSWGFNEARSRRFEIQLDSSQYRVLCIAIREENDFEVHKQVFPVFCRELQITVEVWWKKGIESHRCEKIATFKPRDYPPVVQVEAVSTAKTEPDNGPKVQTAVKVRPTRPSINELYDRILLEASEIDFDARFQELVLSGTFLPDSVKGPEDLKSQWIQYRLEHGSFRGMDYSREYAHLSPRVQEIVKDFWDFGDDELRQLASVVDKTLKIRKS